MAFRASFLATAALALAGCAATTPPPRFEAVSPADPDAPEAATPLPAPVLMGGPEASPPPKPTPTPTPHHHHGGHS